MFDCNRLEDLKIQKVIVITLLRGKGSPDDMCRTVHRYWDMDGNFLFEVDPCDKEAMFLSVNEKDEPFDKDSFTVELSPATRRLIEELNECRKNYSLGFDSSEK